MLGAILVAQGVADETRGPGAISPGAISPSASASTVPTTAAESPAALAVFPAGPPPGRDDVPWQPGTASQVIVVVDASATDDRTAAAIRGGLIDLVDQLPDFDVLTLIASADAVRTLVDGVELQGAGRDEARASIRRLEFGGLRRLVPGVRAATDAAVAIGPGGYQLLLIATGVDGTTPDALREATRAPSVNGSSNVGVDLHAVAVGAGEHQPLLARAASDDYQWADGPSAIARALVPYRLAVSEATLLSHGSVPASGEAVTALVGPNHFGVRFTVVSPGRTLGIEATAPGGRVYTAATRDEAVTVQELGERVTIVVNGVEPGEWRVRITGDAGTAPGAWYEVEETLTLASFLRTAYGTGDTTDDFRTGIAFIGDPDSVRAATARITDPAGNERSIELGPLDQDELNIGAEVVLGAIIDVPQPAGSYRVILHLELTDADGSLRTYEWIEGGYVAPLRDTDGDRISDAIEQHNGLDPNDPADGAFDYDHDGLTTAAELVDHGTLPGEWDTDRGGESDGSEVAAGRDPLDHADDRPAKTCLELMPTPAPGATPAATSDTTPKPVPELEAKLPDTVLGRATTKISMDGPERLDFIFGLFEALLACTGKDHDDLRLAVAIAPELRNWAVVAVEIDGVSGHELSDLWFFRMSRGLTGGLFADAEVGGRAYRLSEFGWAVYATDDTFYWVVSLEYGDFPPSPPPDLPDAGQIIEGFIAQLPLDR
jgi:hypothetical protein